MEEGGEGEKREDWEGKGRWEKQFVILLILKRDFNKKEKKKKRFHYLAMKRDSATLLLRLRSRYRV